MRVLADLVLGRSWLVIAIFVLATGFFAFHARQVETDNRTEALYPDDSRINALVKDLEGTFNQKERLLLVVGAEGESLLTPELLVRVRELHDALASLEGMSQVTSLASARRMEDDDGFLVVEDLVPDRQLSAREAEQVGAYLAASPMYENVALLSRDGRYASFVIEMDDGLDAAAFARSVDRLVRDGWGADYSLAGQAFTSMELQSIIGRDLPILGGTAVGLIVLLLFLNFRSASGVLLPLVQIATGVVWGMGIFQLLGHRLMALTVIGPIAVMAVGSSFALHLLGRYYFELSRGADKRTAISRMITETGLGVLLSGLAIAAAMSTFLLSKLAMVRGLGLVAAIGVLSALLASLLLLPALLNVLPVMRGAAPADGSGMIGRFLKRLGHVIIRRRRLILTVSLALVAFGLVGVFRIVPNTSILAFFPEEGHTRSSVAAVEEVLGGSSGITAWVEGDLLDPQVLAALEDFQEEASRLEGMGPGQSIANVLRALNLTLTGSNSLPDSREAAAQELFLFQAAGSTDDLARFVTLDYEQGIVNFVARSMTTARVAELEAELEQLAAGVLGNRATVRFAGQPLLELEIEQAMRHDFIISLTLALLLVIIIDSFIRSFRAAAVTIVALLATIALQYGILGWLNLPLNLATMLMGALAIGVGDYAIHLTVRYMEERRQGLPPEEAVSESLLTSGRQILFTALTLGAGFSALAFADFVPVATLGGLMLLTVGLVGIATLTLLPAAALVFLRNPYPRHRRSKEADRI